MTIIIALISIIFLLGLHEFGHFITAKLFGVKVEEFGIGYPPRILGKKFGETLYSVNLLPFGAFVKIPGEIEKTDDKRAFSSQAVWKRGLIILAGVVSFWLIAAVLLSVVFAIGSPTAVEDDFLAKDAKVQLLDVSPNSPAKLAGIRPGDAVLFVGLKDQSEKIKIDTVKLFQDFIGLHKGEQIVITIQRGKNVFDAELIPRVSPPAGEGAMGVALVRTAIKNYPLPQAVFQGFSQTYKLTLTVIKGYYGALEKLFSGKPTGVQLTGPVGVFHLISQASELGLNYFFNFMAVIAIYLAIFNLLPIPAVDGGKLLFLGIEAARRKPVPEKIEQNITAAFFFLLIIMAVLVTIKDIQRLF